MRENRMYEPGQLVIVDYSIDHEIELLIEKLNDTEWETVGWFGFNDEPKKGKIRETQIKGVATSKDFVKYMNGVKRNYIFFKTGKLE